MVSRGIKFGWAQLQSFFEFWCRETGAAYCCTSVEVSEDGTKHPWNRTWPPHPYWTGTYSRTEYSAQYSRCSVLSAGACNEAVSEIPIQRWPASAVMRRTEGRRQTRHRQSKQRWQAAPHSATLLIAHIIRRGGGGGDAYQPRWRQPRNGTPNAARNMQDGTGRQCNNNECYMRIYNLITRVHTHTKPIEVLPRCLFTCCDFITNQHAMPQHTQCDIIIPLPSACLSVHLSITLSYYI